MLKPTEHKSVQARILKYAEEIDGTIVSGNEEKYSIIKKKSRRDDMIIAR